MSIQNTINGAIKSVASGAIGTAAALNKGTILERAADAAKKKDIPEKPKKAKPLKYAIDKDTAFNISMQRLTTYANSEPRKVEKSYQEKKRITSSRNTIAKR